MHLDFGDVVFSVGDLIVDRERNEAGILTKRAKILKSLEYDNFTKQSHFSPTDFGWEIMWIAEDGPARKIGIFEGLDRILSEHTMRLSISAGIMEHFPVGSPQAIDFNTKQFIQNKE